jgi:hypothetical protein
LRNKIQVWPHEIWEGGKSQHDEPLLSLCFYGTGYLYAHDSVERRFGSTTEYGSYSPFQADEGLHCGKPAVDWGKRKAAAAGIPYQTYVNVLLDNAASA